jgi:hypothetical protein
MSVAVRNTAFSVRMAATSSNDSRHRWNLSTNSTVSTAMAGVIVYASANAAPTCARSFT